MKQVLLCLCFIASISYVGAQDLPTNPEPGKCYVKCITKDEFTEITEVVEVFPAYQTLKAIPATYKTVTERVLIKEATKKLRYVPAVYETIDVPYIKKEAGSNLSIVDATFRSTTSTLQVYPKITGWEYKKLDDCISSGKDDCVAACFVEYPAQFQDISINSLAQDASTRSVLTDKVSGVYKKRVIKTPARVDEVEIPAEYATITRQIVDRAASTTSVTVPARTQTIAKTVLSKKGGISSWEEVDCALLNPTILPIFYELASARLTPASKKIIDERLLPLLKEKPINIELMSHTDSRGNDDYNMSLSQQRANSVVNYLVAKGISRSRLAAKGYGESRLVNRCANDVDCSDNEHQKNRRTEFRILGN